MRCIRPLKASQNIAGDIVYSSRSSVPGLVGFQFDCRKCLPCMLNQARQKAVRAWHESKMHDSNIFLTCTYSDDHLSSSKLVYRDFQLFMKRLRLCVPDKINYMVTGEYGAKNMRPHWHALLFNYKPDDSVYKYTTDLGHKVWCSEFLSDVWGMGTVEFGDVTLESAGYVARYASKKLVSDSSDFVPIHKTSSRRGIGRSWIEKYYKHTFENGFVVLPDGSRSGIPRYYVDWAKKYRNDVWVEYVTGVLPNMVKLAEDSARKEELDYLSEIMNVRFGMCRPDSRSSVKLRILQRKFSLLNERLKL